MQHHYNSISVSESKLSILGDMDGQTHINHLVHQQNFSSSAIHTLFMNNGHSQVPLPSYFPSQQSPQLKEEKMSMIDEKQQLHHHNNYYSENYRTIMNDSGEIFQERQQLSYKNDLVDSMLNQNVAKNQSLPQWNTESKLTISVSHSWKIGRECDICCEDDESLSFHQLKNCKHTFHAACLHKFLQFQIQERRLPGSCPSCGYIVSEIDMKEILSPEEVEIYERMSLKYELQRNSHLYFFCQTPDCEQYVEKANLRTSFFLCQKCQKQYCVSCSKYRHYGPCQLDEFDKNFIKFARKKLFKTCPKCLKLIERISGCHHMTCICGFQFCYICAKDYRNECTCKNLSYAEHRVLMATQKKQQMQILKLEDKKIREEKKLLKQQEKELQKEEKRRIREEKKEEKQRLKEEKREETRKIKEERKRARQAEKPERKPRKLVKTNVEQDQI